MEEKKERAEMEIRLTDLWAVFKRCWWMMLIVAVVVFAGVYAVMHFTHVDQYSTTVSVYILNNVSVEDGESQKKVTSTDLAMANYLVHDCQTLFTSRDHVLEPVANADLGLSAPVTVEQLGKMVTVSLAAEDARILDISVTSFDRDDTIKIANEFADRACKYLNEEVYAGTNTCNIIDRANNAKISNAISKIKVALIAVACAILLYAIYFMIFLFDDRIATEDDVKKYLGLTLLAVIPNREEMMNLKSGKGRYGKYGRYGRYGKYGKYGGKYGSYGYAYTQAQMTAVAENAEKEVSSDENH